MLRRILKVLQHIMGWIAAIVVWLLTTLPIGFGSIALMLGCMHLTEDFVDPHNWLQMIVWMLGLGIILLVGEKLIVPLYVQWVVPSLNRWAIKNLPVYILPS